MTKPTQHHGTQAQRPTRHQRGDFLLESLIGMLLMAIIGMGVTFVTTRASVAQKDMQVQEIAISQLRQALVQRAPDALCATPPTVALPNGETVTVTAQGCNGNQAARIKANINSTEVELPSPIILSATSASLGTVVVGGTAP